ncbi:MAG TPA: restriction endonuclease [Solirubrobacteraceae bacterium]|nr:restriction endonuclease [Solirubrobacteraceae bacterium]
MLTRQAEAGITVEEQRRLDAVFGPCDDIRSQLVIHPSDCTVPHEPLNHGQLVATDAVISIRDARRRRRLRRLRRRPILGGKVVIQSKRYKNTVGVNAVRDLFGTVHNEGASKGILVTTSGYGQASHEFANGKPLELLDGGNLLSLLQEHAGIEAKIVPPEDWVDPEPDA